MSNLDSIATTVCVLVAFCLGAWVANRSRDNKPLLPTKSDFTPDPPESYEDDDNERVVNKNHKRL